MSEPAKPDKNPPATVDFKILRDTDELVQLCELLRSHPVIMLDTEFERTRTFFPRPALLQVCAGDKIWLVDPLEITDFEPLANLLAAPSVTKVLHSASEDTELLHRLTGCYPADLFDTQIAVGLLGYGFSMGYRRMVQTFCEVELDKSETRSNWLKRPLSDAQLRYASLDVHYLPVIYQRLEEELDASGRKLWLREECDALVNKQRDSSEFARAFERIGQAWRLDPLELGVLRALSAWREREIRHRDIPRSHLLKDDTLLELAHRQPQQVNELEHFEGLSSKERRRSGATLLKIIAKVGELDVRQLPEPLPPPLNSKQFDPILKKLKNLVLETAERIGTAPELLGHRRALETLLRHHVVDQMPGLTAFFEGWRQEVIGETLLNAMNRAR